MVVRTGLRILTVALAASCTIGAAADLGQPVTIAWDANSEPGVAGYRVYVGPAPSAYSEAFDAGNTTSFTYRTGIAGQRYYFAVSAYTSGQLEGPRSSEVSTVIEPLPRTTPDDGDPGDGSDGGGGSGGTPPGEDDPAGIVLDPPTVNGRSVTFAWRPVGSLQPIEYLIEVGSSPGGSNVYNASVGTQTTFSATVQNGSYFARVRGRTQGDESVRSNEVGFSVGEHSCSQPPKTPTGVSGSIASGLATIIWKRAARATSYVVQIGTAEGRSNLFDGNVGATLTAAAHVALPSSIYLRVIAVNACGQSAASTEFQLQ